MLIAVAAIVVLSMQTATPSGGTSSLTSSTPCEITGEGCLLMKVLDSSNNEPAGSLPVQVEALYPACSTNPAHTESLGTQETNASGFLSLSGPYNWYYLSVGYGFQSYPVNASINAGSSTREPRATLISTPSGPSALSTSAPTAPRVSGVAGAVTMRMSTSRARSTRAS